MKANNNAEIDFDTWAELAQNDPKGFETLRLKTIEAAIEKAPVENRERLRRLQWRIDQERRLARTPMGACIRISRMMWRNVLGPGGLQDRFVQLQRLVNGQTHHAEALLEPPAQVVAFARTRD